MSSLFGSSAQNVTTNTAPWSSQQPYLTQGFGGAQNLYQNYTPQYYTGTQVAPFTPAQQASQQAVSNQAMTGEAITGNASNFANNLESGNFLGSNPATNGLANLSGSSVMANNPANQFLAAGQNSVNTLQPWANGAALNNPGNDYLQGIAGGVNTQGMPGGNTLSAFSSGAFANPNNPYSQQAISSIETNVIPQIMSQFAAGGNLSNPNSAFAASQGVANAISPLLEQNYMQGLNQMQQAGTTQQQSALQGLGLQEQAGQNIAQNYLGGANTTVNAGTNATQGIGLLGSVGNSAYGTGLNTNLNALGDISNNYNTGVSQMLSGLGYAPSVQSMPYYDASQLMQVGNQQQGQQQNQINAAMNQWNYNQQLPYNILNAYNGSVGGTSWGGQVTQPYFTNNLANTLATAGLGAGAANQIGNLFGSGGAGGGLLSSLGGLFGGGGAGGATSGLSTSELLGGPSALAGGGDLLSLLGL